jgi:hypothetical protein
LAVFCPESASFSSCPYFDTPLPAFVDSTVKNPLFLGGLGDFKRPLDTRSLRDKLQEQDKQHCRSHGKKRLLTPLFSFLGLAETAFSLLSGGNCGILLRSASDEFLEVA